MSERVGYSDSTHTDYVKYGVDCGVVEAEVETEANLLICNDSCRISLSPTTTCRPDMRLTALPSLANRARSSRSSSSFSGR